MEHQAATLPDGTKAAVLIDGKFQPVRTPDELAERGKAGEKVYRTFDGDLNGYGRFLSGMMDVMLKHSFGGKFPVSARMDSEIVGKSVQFNLVANVGEGALEVQGRIVTDPLRFDGDLFWSLQDAAEFTKSVIGHIMMEIAATPPTVH